MSFYGRYLGAFGGGGGGSSGITSINADANPSQFLVTGTAGTNFAIVDDLAGTHTFNLPVASATNTGKLSNTDWSTFNAKQAALTFGNLTDVGTDGIVITGGTGAVIGSGTSLAQHVADSTHNGYLSSTDWVTFNAKQTAGNYITALTGDVTAAGPGSVAATLATVNSNVGSFGSSTAIPSFTVNGKGLITAASSNVVIAPAGTLTGTTLAANVVTSSLTTVGTIGTGVWQGTAVGALYGGTGGNSSASTGIAHVSSGTWSYSAIVAADIANGTITNTQISSSAAIDRSKSAAFVVQSKTTTYGILASDDLVNGDASGGGFTLTLPAATSVRPVTIIRTDSTYANALTVARAGSDTIEYQGSSLTSFNLYTINETLVLIPDGTSKWYVQSYKTQTPNLAIAYTFDGITSLTNLESDSIRNGTRLRVMGSAVATTVTATTLALNLPSGITIAGLSGLTNVQRVGNFYLVNSGSTQPLPGTSFGIWPLFYDASDATKIFLARGAASSQFTKVAANSPLSNGDSITFDFEIPVTNWKA